MKNYLGYMTAAFSRRALSRRTPIDPNKIIFIHYGYTYSCNPAYICNEILRQKLNWDLVFVTDDKHMTSTFPEGVRVVREYSPEYFHELASARVWIENAMCFPGKLLPKKKGQIFINTWHGSMGLKRIDADRTSVSLGWKLAAKKAGKITDYMISNSAFETEVYRSTYWPDSRVQILEYGHPRNDLLFSGNPEKERIRKKVCRAFQVSEDSRFILYAPTYRDAGDADCYRLDYSSILAAAQKRFGGNWKIINRYHPKTPLSFQEQPESQNNPDILNGTAYPDMQELLTSADLGITDYSSWICDFILTGKPGFLYASDLDSYDRERGFYYPLESTPFPLARSSAELSGNILAFDEKRYQKEREQFLKDRGCRETGQASKKVVELLKSYIQN